MKIGRLYNQLLITGLLGVYLTGCANTPQVSYRHDVQPILANKCMGCHVPPYGEGYTKSGLSMESYQMLMEGSIYGPVIIPGNSQSSPLNMLVEGRAGDLKATLTKRHNPITEEEIRVLRLWVEQGALNN
jgi:hypothetical protein